ncbi:uncharacterized protein LOC106173810 isoform X1 [Lingula anatina]|uniref:Uncharacterized protein LOC106173810 isoform X1 n=2 Tax=Lingula anatina TaxID=7574 RepID=A0A1S3JK60_LINAN|nr:uncharacterized protein LOC106173810 isoform X1 [Lingula anatina]|eukprot:XP_013410516.1 uncharacterized protein LOC106173810 isoform X1 [Lingula anatina]
MAACAATWAFGIDAVKICKNLLQTGDSCLDAVEKSIRILEDDPAYGRYLVGKGGMPNAAGTLQLDAALMEGRSLQYGGVAALEGISTPISVARRVMQGSPHSLLVGQGALEFAKKCGFTTQSNDHLLTAQGREEYEKFSHRLHYESLFDKHDTLGVIALDRHGQIAVGVSSSGAPFKAVGRVGDSPLPGAGLYADDKAGAACATGDGDKMMRFCPSFHVVQLMKQGLSPSECCSSVVAEMVERLGEDPPLEIGLIAMNMQGEIGAGSTVKISGGHNGSSSYNGFAYAVWQHDCEDPKILVHS